MSIVGLPTWLSGKESACQCRRHKRCWWIPGWGKSPEEGNGGPLQDPCLQNPMDRGARQVTVHGAAKEMDMPEHTRTKAHVHTVHHSHACFYQEHFPRMQHVVQAQYVCWVVVFTFSFLTAFSPLKHCSKELKDPTSFSKLLFEAH